MKSYINYSSKKEENFPLIENLRLPTTKPYPKLDLSTSQTMVYITNYELRDYQLQMATTAIHHNTLISIPTGLGKTFIGAVLIANFHRWFPDGKIIFTAPSKPLLIQQMKEIQKILKLSISDFAEISGSIDPNKRKPKWKACKIFFGTPQAIQNDIESKICDASQIVLIVIDEAHRAHGDYSYCKIISLIASVTSFFRVVALTATPGNYFNNVQDLIFNLLIEKIESDSCEKYKYQRKIDKIYIKKEQGFDTLKEKLNQMIEPFLIKMNKERITSITDPEKITKGMVAMWNKQILSKQNRITISKMIRILGLREKLEEYSIEIFDKSAREDGGHDLNSLLKISSKFLKNDAKMMKLREIVKDFLIPSNNSNFSTDNEYSPLTCRQIIIFSNYRLVVEEIVKNLKEINVKCAAFVGQSQSGESKGLNRSKQLKVIDLFKKKLISVLVSTSIGEEGLDIGEVDLIICYDIQKSLTRMVQRIGRTGRKRNGNVIFLINESSKFFTSYENENEDNYFESYADNFLQSNMKYFEMFHGTKKMIPDDLEIIYMKIDENACNDEMNNYYSDHHNSPYLNEEEKHFLAAKFGNSLKYIRIKIGPINKLMFENHASNESKILDLLKNQNIKIEAKNDDSIINNEKDDDFFKISSDGSVDDNILSSEFSSFPSFLASNQIVEQSFLDNGNSDDSSSQIVEQPFLDNGNSDDSSSQIINQSYSDHEDQQSPDGFSKIIVRKSQISAKPIRELFEKSKFDEYDYSDDFITETESFVSTSSECICSSSDEYDEEIIKSPTFINIII